MSIDLTLRAGGARPLTTRVRAAAVALAGGLALAACGGGDVEFTATDAEGVAAIVDAGLTEDSGLQGLLTADAFSQADVDEFNTLAEDACADLADGFDAADYDEFQAGVLDGAEELEGMIDADAMTLALIETTCPSYVATFTGAVSG